MNPSSDEAVPDSSETASREDRSYIFRSGYAKSLYAQGFGEGFTERFAEDLAHGFATAYTAGHVAGEADTVLLVLHLRGVKVTKTDWDRVLAQATHQRTLEWTYRALSVASVDELLAPDD
ncbi:hypothetical protein [Actinomadura parmotrematis]|uniref:Uncharacterized protein n=1 Tax=Actinomadura parmotrematis TaxID=2864039 RepID=A0ABS7FNI8_9ACTN|nr:hypothetical protein [Actinomadura parmotrematis]MBW8481560.1 hypothetical protein [Actinomadura parmotrematis]